MNDYYRGLIKDVRDNYEVLPNSSLEELITTFEYYLQENVDLKSQQEEFKNYLKDELQKCNSYSDYIEKKAQELIGRRVGKTYIANEIMKNECAKKQIKEILSKYKEIIGSDVND